MTAHASALPRSSASAVMLGSLAALVLSTLGIAVLVGASAPLGSPPASGAVAGIPPAYLTAYRSAAERFALGGDGWSYLAAIGKVESDHGRSSAPGVRSGQNAHGCCAGPMQIHNGFGAGTETWGRFKVDGDGDGRIDIYDADDATATAAAYLRASDAPGDWRAAVLAYNHSGSYVERVVDQAAAYRATAASAQVGETFVTNRSRGWLTALPGFPGERCDERIVPDVGLLVRAFSIAVTDCFGGSPHEIGGEHPLGLAVDAVPADGSWNRTLALAAHYGWSPGCARSGCAGRGPFRAILYNGYPGHGDPDHTAHRIFISRGNTPRRRRSRARLGCAYCSRRGPNRELVASSS